MATPVSFGDAYLMAKLCWKIAQAFTKGRNSAPAEFREVESQLYSLSAALAALKDVPQDVSSNAPAAQGEDEGEDNSADGDAHHSARHTLDNIMRNCSETLKHLEKIVLKYGKVADNSTDPARLMFKRWSADLVRNWKKIAWTTEKGDLASLRSQIAVHTNSLNLVLGVLINAKSERIFNNLERNSEMLTEIYEWYKVNLRDAARMSATATSRTATYNRSSTVANATASAAPRQPTVQFGLYRETRHAHGRDEDGLQLICPRACLQQQLPEPNADEGNADAEGPPDSSSADSMFMCCCPKAAHPNEDHTALVAAYAVSFPTYPSRVLGKELSWALHNMADTSRNRLDTIHIRGFPATCIADFEEQVIHPILVRKAMEVLAHEGGNLIAYPTINADKSAFRAVYTTSDLSSIQDLVDSVTWTADGGRRYAKVDVQSLKMLHYAELTGQVGDNFSPSPRLRPLLHAEILLSFARGDDETPQKGPDVMETLLLLKHNNVIEVDQRQATVSIKGIECRGSEAGASQISKAAQPQHHSYDLNFHDDGVLLDVKLQFTTSKAASIFHSRVQEMQMDLFTFGLLGLREGEKTVLTLQVTEVQCEDIFIPQAELEIVQGGEGEKRRMIITSSNRCTVISQDLPPEFFNPGPHNGSPSLSQWPSTNGKLYFASTAWIVQLEGAGSRNVFRYAEGIKGLSLRHPNSVRAFDLARSAITGAPRLPIRPRPESTEDGDAVGG